MVKHPDSSASVQHVNELNEFHCDEGPALVWEDGTQAWYQNGVIHKEDGPAVESSIGTNL